MKIIKNSLVFLFVLLLAIACNEGIDPISRVDPGADLTAPVVKITYPAEGLQIKRPELVSSVKT